MTLASLRSVMETLFPDIEMERLRILDEDDRKTGQATALYVSLVRRSIAHHPGIAMAINGKPCNGGDIAELLVRKDPRWVNAALDKLASVGLVTREADGGVLLPKVEAAAALCSDESATPPPQPVPAPQVPPTPPPQNPVPPPPSAPSLGEAHHAEAAAAVPEEDLPPEVLAMREKRKILEADFRTYFKQLRAVGQRDATPENEEEFWQYLLLADFCKADGSPIDKHGLKTSFIAWMRNRKREDREFTMKQQEKRQAEAEAEAKRQADAAAYEDWNDRMLRNDFAGEDD